MIGNLWAQVVYQSLLVSFRHANVFLFDSLGQLVFVEELESFEFNVSNFVDLLFTLLFSLLFFFLQLLLLAFPVTFALVQVAVNEYFVSNLLAQYNKFVWFAGPG